jgi:hypothetical protein
VSVTKAKKPGDHIRETLFVQVTVDIASKTFILKDLEFTSSPLVHKLKDFPLS